MQKLLFYFLCCIGLLLFIKNFFGTANNAIVYPIPEYIFANKKNTPTQMQKKLQSIGTLLASEIENAPGEYGIYLKDLQTNEEYTYNAHLEFETASLYKLWVMGEVYRQVQNEKLTEEQVLSQSVSSLNRAFGLSDDVAEQTSGTISLSIADALHQMITISHNYAAHLLTAKIRLSTVTDFLKTYHLTSSKVGTTTTNPVTTASDIGKFLELIYTNKLISHSASQKMLNVLKEQKLNNKLPKYLPKDTVIAHKTGELGSFTHDAGIVYTHKGNYIIVVLGKYGIPTEAEEFIATLSKKVFDTYIEE